MIRFFRYARGIKIQTIEVDDETATALQQRAAERGVSVSELVAELVTLNERSVATERKDIVELDRRWKSFQAQGSATSNGEVVHWMRTWGTPAFRKWRDR